MGEMLFSPETWETFCAFAARMRGGDGGVVGHATGAGGYHAAAAAAAASPQLLASMPSANCADDDSCLLMGAFAPSATPQVARLVAAER
jgi:hypothetical protein